MEWSQIVDTIDDVTGVHFVVISVAEQQNHVIRWPWTCWKKR